MHRLEDAKEGDLMMRMLRFNWTSPITQIHWTATFTFSSFLTPKPMYDMIWAVLPCTIHFSGCSKFFLVRYALGNCSMYDINLRATHTTILSTRGVKIPINLVSSATDSIRRHVVLFKPVLIPTSDLKSEFLCQSSQSAQDLQTPPWTTSYAWDISHAFLHHVSSLRPEP